jgi:predicted nucleic acid-binding protein
MKMNKAAAVYDTRFFTQLYRSENEELLKKLQNEKNRKEKYVSTIAIHELYNTSLAIEGREVAKVKVAFVKQEFKIIPVNEQIAEVSAEFRHKYDLSMGDSMIAATAFALDAICISDDAHFQRIKEIKTAWI